MNIVGFEMCQGCRRAVAYKAWFETQMSLHENMADESELLLHAIATKLKEREIKTPEQEITESLSELQEQYKEHFKKDVPLRFKNAPAWIKKQLDAA